MDPNQVPAQTAPPTIPAKPPPALRTQSTSYFKRIFQGRLNRRNYWAGNIIPTLCLVGILLYSFTTFFWLFITNLGDSPLDTPPILKLAVFPLAIIENTIEITLFFSIISLTVRRLHDLNKNGWLFLITLIPLINLFFALYLSFWPGTEGNNKYGSKPLPRINLKSDILKLG